MTLFARTSGFSAHHTPRLCWLILPVSMLVSAAAHAGAIGVRSGWGSGSHDYRAQELYWRFPVSAQPDDDGRWSLEAHGELNAGRVTLGDDAMRTLGAGIGAWLGSPRGAIRIGMGTGPTYITEGRLGDQHFGGPWQFTTHVSVRIRVGSRFSLGYRLQHTSNAGLYDRNQGYDLQALEVQLSF